MDGVNETAVIVSSAIALGIGFFWGRMSVKKNAEAEAKAEFLASAGGAGGDSGKDTDSGKGGQFDQ